MPIGKFPQHGNIIQIQVPISSRKKVEVIWKSLLTLLHRGISSCKALIFSFILSLRFCTQIQCEFSENQVKKRNSKKNVYLLKQCIMYVQTLSERLWTSAARDLLLEVDPRPCFLPSADSKSTSFCSKAE